MSDSQPVSTQSSRQSNVDLVIDAVARGEFDRGDEFNYYSSQNTTASSSTDRRHSHNGTDDHTNWIFHVVVIGDSVFDISFIAVIMNTIIVIAECRTE